MKKNVLITGASSDLGKSLARKFASNNYNLILTYNSNNCSYLKEELESTYKVTVDCYKLDITNLEEVTKTVENIDNIDILINNAAYTSDDDIYSKDINEFKKVIDTNITGTFIITREVSKKMLKNKNGSIVNISSTNSIDTNYPESIDYDASKAAINSMTLNFADYLAPHIRVNAVLPGWINTSINKELNPNFKKQEEEKILLKRFANPDEIANTVYNIATDTYINKSIIRVDGGYNG